MEVTEESQGDGRESSPESPAQYPFRTDPDDQDESMGQGSIPTTMGVKEMDEVDGRFLPVFHPPLHSSSPRVLDDFVIPLSPWGSSKNQREVLGDAALSNSINAAKLLDDDISVLTEYSGMEEEEDASSQVTAGTEARTVVTTTTGDTTVPAGNHRNSLPSSMTSSQLSSKLPSGAVDQHHGLPPLENSQFKRRRIMR